MDDELIHVPLVGVEEYNIKLSWLKMNSLASVMARTQIISVCKLCCPLHVVLSFASSPRGPMLALATCLT